MAFNASLWGQQATHTINIGQVPSSQSNVPLLITKNLASFPSSMLDGGSTSALNGGGDIRVSTDAAGVNQLPVEIVSCVTSATPANQELIMWVRVPTANDGEVIYITWNRAGQSQPPVTDTFGRNAVWQDYAFVTHDGGVTESTAGLAMVDDGSGSVTTALYDQAALTAPLQRTSSLTAGDLTSNFSITAWGNFYNNAGTLLSRRDAGTRQYHFGVLANALYFITTASTSTASLGAVNNAAWTKATVSVTSGTDIDAYVDGVSTGNYNRGTISSQSLPLRVGYRGNGGLGTVAAASPAIFFECRVRNSTITADFETTEYNNIIDQNAWATIGTPYVPGVAGVSATITEAFPSPTESISLSITVTASVTEAFPSPTESINVSATFTVEGQVTESFPSPTESISVFVGGLVTSQITEIFPSPTELINANVKTSVVVSVTEVFPSLSESLIAVIPGKVVINGKRVTRVNATNKRVRISATSKIKRFK